MRIMVTSDLHGNLEGLDPKGADVVNRGTTSTSNGFAATRTPTAYY